MKASPSLIQASGKEPITHLISEEMEHFQPDSLVIIITPSADKNITAAVREVRRIGCMVVVILLDRVSFGGGKTGIGLVRDLMMEGAQVHTVRKGQNIALALDSRRLSSLPAYGE